MSIIYKEIISISSSEEPYLTALLDESFPSTFEGRCYFKQEPHSRILAYSDGKIVGHIGIDRRVVNVAGRVLKVVGVIDLCVSPNFRDKGIGAALLNQVEKQALVRDFIILMADNEAIYRKAGFRRLKTAQTKWLAIESLKSHSIIERDLSDCLMYKPINSMDWPDGKIDMLGYLF